MKNVNRESNVLSPEESVEQQPHPASRIKKLCNDKGIRSSGDVSKDYNNMINKKENDEDDEDLQYVDVETVDEKLDSKEQRRALVEFYRKVKSVRVSLLDFSSRYWSSRYLFIRAFLHVFFFGRVVESYKNTASTVF
ncbi:unnamed protein product [Gongylonema pulchrum]|uniref:Uncharacterized protein n=1 Tax=Gongylonema pulchrum TaxID=637853 RepID=A0A183EK04_9BILA|nr:unnamed protein product [Gongylonema pulchrum]